MPPANPTPFLLKFNQLAHFVGRTLGKPVATSLGINSAVEKLQSEVQAVAAQDADIYRDFCIKTIAEEPELFENYKCCDADESCLVLDSASNALDQPLADKKLERTLDLFKDRFEDGTLAYGKRYEGVFAILYQLQLLEIFLDMKLDRPTLKVNQEPPATVDRATIVKEGDMTHLEALSFVFPEAFETVPSWIQELLTASGNTPAKLKCAAGNNCKMVHLLHSATPKLDKVGDRLLEAFDLANTRIEKFVDDTIQTFKSQLATADEGLLHFNCQLVGTSMQEGVKAGLCNVVMPSIAFLALFTILLWVISGFAAFVSWKIYHYYRDLTDDELKALSRIDVPEGYMGHTPGTNREQKA